MYDTLCFFLTAALPGAAAAGDTTNMGLWLALAGIAAVGLAGVLFYRKKNGK